LDSEYIWRNQEARDNHRLAEPSLRWIAIYRRVV